MTGERRKSPRVKGHIRIGYGKEEIHISELTEDLSMKGLFVRTPYPLELETPLKVEIHFTPAAQKSPLELVLQGRVSRVHHSKDPEGMAIEFVNLTATDQKLLASLIERVSKKKTR